jgi:putative transposase
VPQRITKEMNNYNPNIHHRRSIRLKGYDYSQEGLYFITINTKDRECLLGKIINAEMVLNDAGKIANECWLEIPKHFPNVIMHEYIIMPNHVHGIIELIRVDDIPDQIAKNVGTRHVVSLHNRDHNHGDNHNQFSKPIPGSISVIIQQYKSSVTRFFNKNNVSHFSWQSRFYEHIIRNEKSHQQITDYTLTNPRNWQEDKFFNE